MLEDGILITLRGKTGWREVEVARGSSDQTSPVHALTQWLHYARIDFGPIFVATSRNGLKATGERLSDKHVARLIKSCAREAELRPDLPEAERGCSRAIPCGRVWPAARKLTSAMFKGSSAMHRPR